MSHDEARTMIAGLLAATALAAPPSPQAVVDRVIRFGETSPRMSVEMRIQVDAGQPATGSLIWEKPDRQRFTLRFAGRTYTFVQRGAQAIEHETQSQLYFGFRVAPGELTTPFARVDALPTFGYPAMIVPGTPSQRSLKQGTLSYVGTADVQGESTDQIRRVTESPMGKATLDLWVDAQGRIRRYVWRMEAEEGESTMRFEFSNWTSAPALTAATFDLRPPNGFLPYELPFLTPPVERGQAPAWSGQVRSLANGRDVPAGNVLARGKTTLLILTDPGCEVSRRAAGFLDEASGVARGQRAAVVRVSLGAAAPAAGSADYWDRAGAVERAVGVPGTPMMLLFGPDGKLRQAWVGDPPRRRSAVLDELRAQLSR